jgi:hypothetical protein
MSVDYIHKKVREERIAQELAGFTAEHDDHNMAREWIVILARQLGLAAPETGQWPIDNPRWERGMIRIMATAQAALETYYRRFPPSQNAGVKEGSGF